MGLEEAFAKHEALARAGAELDAFGHLMCPAGVLYYGGFVFASSEYGGQSIVVFDHFENDLQQPLENSPWQYDHLHSYLSEVVKKYPKLPVGTFLGYYVRFKSGGFRFTGECQEYRPSTHVKATLSSLARQLIDRRRIRTKGKDQCESPKSSPTSHPLR